MAEKHPCQGCYYFGGRWKYSQCCNYYLITNKRRPCPPGDLCIVRKDGTRDSRKAMVIKSKRNANQGLKEIQPHHQSSEPE